MRKIAVITLALLSSAVFAQANQSAAPTSIKGNTEIKAKQENTLAVAAGEGNTAKNTAGAIKGGTSIKGNTKINAEQKNTLAVAAGKNNTAANEAGVIGGK